LSQGWIAEVETQAFFKSKREVFGCGSGTEAALTKYMEALSEKSCVFVNSGNFK